MSENLMLFASLVGGASLGMFFFGGLLWTVQSRLLSERPAVWFLGSLVFRTSVVLGGFYLMSQGHSVRLAVSLMGFVVARFVIMSRVKPSWAIEGPRSEMEVQRAH